MLIHTVSVVEASRDVFLFHQMNRFLLYTSFHPSFHAFLLVTGLVQIMSFHGFFIKYLYLECLCFRFIMEKT